MGALQRIVVSSLVAGACIAQGCIGTPPADDMRVDNRDVPLAGIIEGTASYQGPQPCSLYGHIVGDLILLVFTTSNPPPPAGLATTAVNFQVIQGDTLFYDQPRTPGSTLYCPRDNGFTAPITATAPFIISPMDAGQYIIQAFYDYYGDFRPNIDIRELPLLGDISGGAIDVNDAFAPDPTTNGTTQKYQNPNYAPIFVPIGVGIPDDPNPPPGVIPTYSFPTNPSNGFVASNVAVTVGLPNTLTRPYAWMQGLDSMGNVVDGSDHVATGKAPGSTEADPEYVPILTMPQDIQVDALPNPPLPQYIDIQQSTFAAVRLNWGVAPKEVPSAVDPNQPFHFQIPTSNGAIDDSSGGLYAWDRGFPVPESSLLRAMWPFVVFGKLADDGSTSPFRMSDPQNIVPQGSTTTTDPIVIIQGITLNQDSLANTAPVTGADVPASPSDPAARVDHVTVLIRPTVVCFNPAAIQNGGVLVTPWIAGPNPASTATPPALAALPDLKAAQAYQNAMNPNAPPVIASTTFGCLPVGRYGVNLVYPTGQAWTLPNLAGNCATDEGKIAGLNGGSTDYSNLTCSTPGQGRHVLFSQGTRAVIEITPATDPTHCVAQNPNPPTFDTTTNTTTPPPPVPDPCLPCAQRVDKDSMLYPECASVWAAQ
jgi:hypothetical protein